MRRLARLAFAAHLIDEIGGTIHLPDGVRPIGYFRLEGTRHVVVESLGDDLPTALSPWVAQVRQITYHRGPDGISLTAQIGDHPFRPTHEWSIDQYPELLPIQQVHQIARLCHEANRAWCEVNDDMSQKPWRDAEGWQTKSAIQGVMWALENPEAPPSAQHDAWMADKISQGWQHGPEKDPAARRHPCLVPYRDLPVDQRMKDALFGALVTGMAQQFRHEARVTIARSAS